MLAGTRSRPSPIRRIPPSVGPASAWPTAELHPATARLPTRDRATVPQGGPRRRREGRLNTEEVLSRGSAPAVGVGTTGAEVWGSDQDAKPGKRSGVST